MPLTAGRKALEKCTVPNGDCAAAEDGVIEPDTGPDIFGVVNVGVGGI
jgi:hypothetical protein